MDFTYVPIHFEDGLMACSIRQTSKGVRYQCETEVTIHHDPDARYNVAVMSAGLSASTALQRGMLTIEMRSCT